MPLKDYELGGWRDVLLPLNKELWCETLFDRVETAYAQGSPTVYPPKEQLFTALRLTPPEQVRCVVVGQDPYHEAGQAHGLAFSVQEGVRVPPSLRNIYKELQSDLGVNPPTSGDLTGWAEQGVLLLNNVLTVYDGQAGSHKGWGWEQFTTEILRQTVRLPQPVAYLLWGKAAQTKAALVAPECSPYPRLVLKSNHPSPLSASRGFFGSRPFSQVNGFLVQQGGAPIDWSRTGRSCGKD
ncbi:MAG: uracil-DNA glycosylase [Clostridiales bacterium]|nr:uracil-DNA glycosylase [Clostridiales bacterium]